MYKYLPLLLFFISIPHLYSQSLLQQYRFAYELARDIDGLNFTDKNARNWAKTFIEQKALLNFKLSLRRQYIEANAFAINDNGLKMPPKEADHWAKSFILNRGTFHPAAKMFPQLQQFLNETSFTDEEGKKWCEDFLNSKEHIYSSVGLLERYRDIYRFIRENFFLGYNHERAHNLAQQFILQRYRYAFGLSLFQQFVFAYEFALQTEGLALGYEEARKWAEGFISQNGVLNPKFNLINQFQQAKNFAKASGGLTLDADKARDWARDFLQTKGNFFPGENLFSSYREAYLFAYSSDILPMITEVRELPLEITYEMTGDNEDLDYIFELDQQISVWRYYVRRWGFRLYRIVDSRAREEKQEYPQLADEAEKWAKEFISQRTISSPEKNLLEQYNQAFVFARLSDGLKLDYYTAKNWAKEFIERKEK